MKIIGVTGGVGSGKTQVLAYIHDKYGATVCHTDQVGRKLQKKGTECFQKIVEHFGEDILNEKGELDREKLADIVFSDENEREAINAIVHPAVREEIEKMIKKEERRNTNLFLVESALLIENHYEELCDELWYVYVKTSNRKKRLIYARGYDSDKVDEIMAAQLPKEVYLKHCDRVIDNNEVFEATQLHIDEIMADLRKAE